jgi:hypothetical protein
MLVSRSFSKQFTENKTKTTEEQEQNKIGNRGIFYVKRSKNSWKNNSFYRIPALRFQFGHTFLERNKTPETCLCL